MKSAVRASLGALEIAGSLCGVPFVGAAAIVLKDIINACDEVRVRKVNAEFISMAGNNSTHLAGSRD
jgi:hypothetical protein